MKLWKITHHHGRAPLGATVHLLPHADEPTEAEALATLPFRLDLAQGEVIDIEYTGYQVAPFYTDLLDAARELLVYLKEGNVTATTLAIARLDRAAHEVAKVKPRCLIFVGGGMVTDVFSTERTMDVSILDAQDMKSLTFALDTIDQATRAGTNGLYRIL